MEQTFLGVRIFIILLETQQLFGEMCPLYNGTQTRTSLMIRGDTEIHSKSVACCSMGLFPEVSSSLDRVVKRISDVTYRIQNCKGRPHRLVVHFNCLKFCTERMRFDGQGGKLLANSPVINEDCFDKAHQQVEHNTVLVSDENNVPAINASAHEDAPADGEVIQDVPNAPSRWRGDTRCS